MRPVLDFLLMHEGQQVDREIALQRRDWEDLAQIDAIESILSDFSRQFGSGHLEEFFASAADEMGELKQLVARVGFRSDLAQIDAIESILSDFSRQFGSGHLEEFFASAADEMGELKQLVARVGFAEPFDAALDFGCGLGRLTRAMKSFCREVVGVDISEEMVRQAQLLNPNCQFVHNPYNDLRVFSSGRFDLVYSFQVLQHQRSAALIRNYVSEFIRVLKPGGLALFQVPYRISFLHRLQPRRRMFQILS